MVIVHQLIRFSCWCKRLSIWNNYVARAWKYIGIGIFC